MSGDKKKGFQPNQVNRFERLCVCVCALCHPIEGLNDTGKILIESDSNHESRDGVIVIVKIIISIIEEAKTFSKKFQCWTKVKVVDQLTLTSSKDQINTCYLIK